MKKLNFNTFRAKAALFFGAFCFTAAMHAQTWTSVSSFSPSNYTKETGTIIGTSGSFSGGSSDDKTKVFDNSLNTYFDGPTANGVWVGLDLGSIKNVQGIIFVPRNGNFSRMDGGVFQASTDASFTNVTNLFTIPAGMVAAFVPYYLVNSVGTQTRYIRYFSPNNGWGNIAEMSVYTAPSSSGGNTVSGWNLSGNSGTTPDSQFLGTTDGQPLVVKTNNTERVRVSASGYLGIGTSNPGAYLDIASWNDWNSPAVRLSKPGGRDIRIINDNYGFSLRNFTQGDGPIFNVRNTSDNIAFAVNDNGNVGIGTTSPAQKLDVAGTVKATGFQLPVANYNANTQYIVKADANGNFSWVPFRDIQSIYAGTWGANVNCSGYKLVGAANGTSGLKVNANGTVTAPGFACDSVRTADFVFEPEYQLQPLHQVEEFIQANRHLPGVPSADEYQKRGQVDMSELQNLLLQKVEELTLYVIQQNRNNEALKQRISELEKGLGKK